MMDQSPLFSERSRFEEMVRYVSGTLAYSGGIESFDRVGDTGVQSLLAWNRDACK